jgi:formylglycine-generating enzyme required for sulfatase activity
MEFVLISAGHFAMGASDRERKQAFALVKDSSGITKEERYADESPLHEVIITHSFYLGRFEVTQKEWLALMDDNPSANQGCGANCPVANVSWDEVQEFIRRLNEQDPGHGYRLPTEAEWEYAARAGEASALLKEPVDNVGWYAANSGNKQIDSVQLWRNDPQKYGEEMESNHNRSHEVGKKKPNRWGLYDMFGNVWEWVSDFYDASYYQYSPKKDPAGPEIGTERVLRGGSYDHNSLLNAAVTRVKYVPSGKSPSFGFRLLVSPATKLRSSH